MTDYKDASGKVIGELITTEISSFESGKYEEWSQYAVMDTTLPDEEISFCQTLRYSEKIDRLEKIKEDKTMEIEKEDNYISYTGTLESDDGTEYEYWAHRSRIVKTGKWKVGGHITVSNPKKCLYEVRERRKIEDLLTKELAEIHTDSIRGEFEEIIIGWENLKDSENQ